MLAPGAAIFITGCLVARFLSWAGGHVVVPFQPAFGFFFWSCFWAHLNAASSTTFSQFCGPTSGNRSSTTCELTFVVLLASDIWFSCVVLLVVPFAGRLVSVCPAWVGTPGCCGEMFARESFACHLGQPKHMDVAIRIHIKSSVYIHIYMYIYLKDTHICNFPRHHVFFACLGLEFCVCPCFFLVGACLPIILSLRKVALYRSWVRWLLGSAFAGRDVVFVNMDETALQHDYPSKHTAQYAVATLLVCALVFIVVKSYVHP